MTIMSVLSHNHVYSVRSMLATAFVAWYAITYVCMHMHASCSLYSPMFAHALQAAVQNQVAALRQRLRHDRQNAGPSLKALPDPVVQARSKLQQAEQDLQQSMDKVEQAERTLLQV